MAARILHAIGVAIVLVVVTAAFGHAFYAAHIPSGVTLLRFAVMLGVGAATFCALGLAMTALVPNADAAGAMVERQHPAPCSSRDLHPARQQHPGLDPVDRPDLPGPPLRGGHAGRVRGDPFPLERRAGGGRLGAGGLVLATRYFSWGPPLTTRRPGPGRGVRAEFSRVVG